MSARRLFIALPLPEPIRAVVTGLQDAQSHDIRWTHHEQLHVTLRFLGDTPEEKIDSLNAQLGEIQVGPFLLSLEAIGAFSSKSIPRVLWLGLGSGHPRLYQLRQRVDDALLATGVDADLRHFHPHITLARCTDSPAATTAAGRWLKTNRDFIGPSFQVDAFELCSSELRPTGAIHHRLATFPLAK